jgi:Xaa-Pro aminopeptidase
VYARRAVPFGALTDVLIFADSLRSPELRHEVPVAVPDPFLYAEHDGSRHTVVTSFEIDRITEVAPGVENHPYEEFGFDELVGTMSREDAELEMYSRAVKKLGISRAVVPQTFPLGLADHLRGEGIEITVDRDEFLRRRRVKNPAELEGIRRASRAAEAGMRTIRDALARAETSNGTLAVDGEPLTCERLKIAVERAFSEHGAAAEEFIVSHGAQTAIGHEGGSGPIAPGEPIVADLFPRDRQSGCFTDMTRTFVAGPVPDELAEYQRLCRDALKRAVDHVRPGTTGRELFEATCELFQEHGYPTQLSKEPGQVLDHGFFHSLGHGVGLEVHEQPWLGRGPGELMAGDVIAVEPGLYRQGFGGCRLEDLVLVTEDGAEVLTDFPYDLSA